jgi:hypothetical protein
VSGPLSQPTVLLALHVTQIFAPRTDARSHRLVGPCQTGRVLRDQLIVGCAGRAQPGPIAIANQRAPRIASGGSNNSLGGP